MSDSSSHSSVAKDRPRSRSEEPNRSNKLFITNIDGKVS
jgi:hypothetical protein